MSLPSPVPGELCVGEGKLVGGRFSGGCGGRRADLDEPEPSGTSDSTAQSSSTPSTWRAGTPYP